MLYLAFALQMAAGFAAATYLVMHGHPWFAGAILLIVAAVTMEHKKDGGSAK